MMSDGVLHQHRPLCIDAKAGTTKCSQRINNIVAKAKQSQSIVLGAVWHT